MKIGVSVYSIRQQLHKDLWGSYEKIAKMGYDGVEIINSTSEGMLDGGLKPEEQRKQFEQLGLEVISTHVDPPEDGDWERLIDYNARLGSQSIVLPIWFFNDEKEVAELAALCNKLGELCQKYKLRFYYHTHFQEFRKRNGLWMIEHLLKETNPDLVKLELDVFWIQRAGEDCLRVLKMLEPRCELVHMKDIGKNVQKINILEDAPDLLYYDYFNQIRANGTILPEDYEVCGKGQMNLAPLVDFCSHSSNIQRLIVEQDEIVGEPFESIQGSLEYLKMLLKGE